MGKLRDVPRRTKSSISQSRRKTTPTSRKAAHSLAAFDAVIRMRDAQWTAMRAKEQAEEVEAWERVKESINGDHAGYRQVFVDD